MEIPAGMLSESMDELDDPLRFCRGDIDPRADSIPFVIGEKIDFMQHKNTSVSFYDLIVNSGMNSVKKVKDSVSVT